MTNALPKERRSSVKKEQTVQPFSEVRLINMVGLTLDLLFCLQILSLLFCMLNLTILKKDVRRSGIFISKNSSRFINMGLHFLSFLISQPIMHTCFILYAIT